MVMSSSNKKLRIIRGLGASGLIDYKTMPEWADEVLWITGEKGIDLVVHVGCSRSLVTSHSVLSTLAYFHLPGMLLLMPILIATISRLQAYSPLLYTSIYAYAYTYTFTFTCY
jgi:hypothetical protein